MRRWKSSRLRKGERRKGEAQNCGPWPKSSLCGLHPYRQGSELRTSLKASRRTQRNTRRYWVSSAPAGAVTSLNQWPLLTPDFELPLTNQRTREHGAPVSTWNKQAGCVCVCVSSAGGRRSTPLSHPGRWHGRAPQTLQAPGEYPRPSTAPAPRRGPRNNKKPRSSMPFCVFSVRCAIRFSGWGAPRVPGSRA